MELHEIPETDAGAKPVTISVIYRTQEVRNGVRP
jgi:hypothetical protein